jgi:hypothetical protein
MAVNAEALQLEPTTTQKPVSQWMLVWRRLRKHKLAMVGMAVFAAIVLLSLLAPVIAPYSYEEINLTNSYARLLSPGDEGKAPHILGTDKLGRDIFSRLLYAGRISLGVALVVTLLTMFLGTLVGAAAGAFGGITDTVLMRRDADPSVPAHGPGAFQQPQAVRRVAGLSRLLDERVHHRFCAADLWLDDQCPAGAGLGAQPEGAGFHRRQPRPRRR